MPRPAGDILLVSMPFGSLFTPSLGLSLLKAGLARQGLRSAIRYFSIRFAELIGETLYTGIASDDRPSMRALAGEWVFAHALFEAAEGDEDRYVDEVLLMASGRGARSWDTLPSPAVITRLRRARRLAPAFLEWCLREVVRRRPRVVGFTSVFQQHVASLALARRIKQERPDTFIVFGGANCEAVMGAETVRRFPFVDAAVSGEGDLVFPELARRVLAGEPVSGLAGVHTRETVEDGFLRGHFPNAPMVRDMDALPVPDYGDFFAQFARSRFGRHWQPGLLFETSRGCWWGQKMHCTFCGLNGATMAFRSKSPARALAELEDITRRHPGCDVQVADNILDMSYFKTVLPELARRRSRASLFYETKANLKKEQVALLRAAGVRQIQPGIESFSDPVLRLMRKGVTGLQSIQLLKWCKEAGVEPYWNFLWGFPGEAPSEYERMARLVPWLTHLTAPCGFSDIRLDRFSPNFFDAESLGFEGLAPLPAYGHVYRLPEEAVANLACFFTFDYREPRDVESYVRPLVRELSRWLRVEKWSELFSVDLGRELLVWDQRPAARSRLTALEAADAVLYRACDAVTDLPQLVRAAERQGFRLSEDEVEGRLQPLLEGGLMLRDGGRLLALAIPLGEYSPSAEALERFWRLAGKGARPTREGLVLPLPGERGQWRPRRAVGSRRSARTPVRRRKAWPLAPSQFVLGEDGELLIRRGPPRPPSPERTA